MGGGDSPCNSPNKAISMELVNTPSNASDSHSYEQMNHCDETVPSPQHVTEVELKVLQSCLKRWRKEIESNVKSKSFLKVFNLCSIGEYCIYFKKIVVNEMLKYFPSAFHFVCNT